MNTKRTWASRVLACITDRKSGWIVGGGFFFRQGANCEGWSLVWSTIECDTGLATSYEGSSGCRGPILCISRGAHTVPDVSFAHAREARWVCGTVMQSCNLDHGMAVAARSALPRVG